MRCRPLNSTEKVLLLLLFIHPPNLPSNCFDMKYGCGLCIPSVGDPEKQTPWVAVDRAHRTMRVALPLTLSCLLLAGFGFVI